MPALYRLILVSILLLLQPVAAYSITSTEKMLFSPKRITGDANDMSLRSIIQLPDGRMAFIFTYTTMQAQKAIPSMTADHLCSEATTAIIIHTYQATPCCG
ncbi:hypothetical protein [uncultured Duncaniella sp.]|uniref:hypothetical protein n=1 Tax=uncultured Duncaniella sp. TaxID=2768039 RepID=UPI0025AF9042|nr:hypothetical protein [uncultured Duncaniella sp.]